MGSIDLVVQVGPPPSVSSGLQRVGRAGHQVGAISKGIIFPLHRGELPATAVIAQRMREGVIEPFHRVRNPLDVLAQQIVAMLAMDEWIVDDLAALIRYAAPFASLGEASLHAVLDMLAGRYPSEDFGELRARIVWDRTANVLSARPGALRLATTSGGTIPDRGLYGVFLVDDATPTDFATESEQDALEIDQTSAGKRPNARTTRLRGGKRVGELDEEMVYESRVGDVFTLGSSTWRIEEITPDRVLVSPAPGLPGRLPFWKGDSLGRPVELGRAIGQWLRTTVHGREDDPTWQGLDQYARENLARYIDEQVESTGVLPSDSTIVVERFKDELGDWRVVIHTPFGARVHGPWALIIGDRIRERYGIDASVMHQDDGIVLRIPTTGDLLDFADPFAEEVEEPSNQSVTAQDLFVEPDLVSRLVREQVSDSSLFGARFREAAARALLLPKARPDKRQPLWQQRQRSAQLLSVAANFPDFPIVLEAVRECLQDDFDVPALKELMTQVSNNQVRVVEVTTPTPSPFAQSLLFGYTAQYLYDGDAPLAERRAAALTLDPALLAELLGAEGSGDLADLLDPEAVRTTAAEIGYLTPVRAPKTAEHVWEFLLRAGPHTEEDIARRIALTMPADLPNDTEPHKKAALPNSTELPDGSGVSNGAGPSRDKTPTPTPASESTGDSAANVTRLETEDMPGGEDSSAIDTHVADETEPQSGDVTRAEYGERQARTFLEHLERTRRIIPVRFAGLTDSRVRWTAIEDAGRLRDALGVALPVGVPEAFTEVLPDPLGDLVRKHARTHVPFTADSLAARFGLGVAVVQDVLRRLTASGHLVEGRLLPDELGGTGHEYCDADVLRMLRRRSLAALRAEVEPVAPQTLGIFLPTWQKTGQLRGVDGLYQAIEQLSGAPLPLSALESQILPARVTDYRPSMLDELTTSGEVLWFGHRQLPGPKGGKDAMISLHLLDGAELTLPSVTALADHDELSGSLVHESLHEYLSRGGAYFLGQICADLGLTHAAAASALWDLVWAGHVTNDSFTPLRALLGKVGSAPSSRTPTRARGARSRFGSLGRPLNAQPVPSAEQSGRWSALPLRDSDPTRRLAASATVLMDRYGVVTRNVSTVEELEQPFAQVYRVLSTAETLGKVRRGYFIEKLGGSQFAHEGAVDLLRRVEADMEAANERKNYSAQVLAACDPANPYGAMLPWPEHDDPDLGHRPGRKAGASVILVNGGLTFYVERGGKTLLTYSDDLARLTSAASALAEMIDRGRMPKIHFSKINALPALSQRSPTFAQPAERHRSTHYGQQVSQ
jgi:ATP-dependent Lhr-like helicase